MPDSMLRSDRNLFNEAWYRMDLRTRININNQVIDKSIKKAIAEKNNKQANTTASFAASIE